MRLSINSPAGMGRRVAIFQSSRLRYCIIVRWAMLGNSVECLPVISYLPLLAGSRPVYREGVAPCSANIAERRDRQLLPAANALLNTGCQSPHDIAIARWKV